MFNQGVSKQESQLVELQLKEAIRYNDNDPVEIWMDHLFCLTPSQSYSFSTPPQTKACQLFYVNLNALFDSSPTSERLLHSIVSILVESHYKVKYFLCISSYFIHFNKSFKNLMVKNQC